MEELDKSEHGHAVHAAVVPEHAESKSAEAAPVTSEANVAPPAKPPVQAAVMPEAPPAKPAEPTPANKDTDIRLAGLFPDSKRGLHLPNPGKPPPIELASALPVAPDPANLPAPPDVDAVQKKYQPQLDNLTKNGLAHYHFVSYAPASLGIFPSDQNGNLPGILTGTLH